MTAQQILDLIMSVIGYPVELTERQVKLFKFIAGAHSGQKRLGGEKYINHLIRVGERAEASNYVRYGREIGWAHDLYEDQLKVYDNIEAKHAYFKMELLAFGYSPESAKSIANGVLDLTNQYTHEKYPSMSRAQRQTMERIRLWGVSENSQSIKYCDVIDNISTTSEMNPKFARIYIEEKSALLLTVNGGDRDLLATAWKTIAEAKARLKQL